MKKICLFVRKFGLSAILALPLSGATLVVSTGAMDAWDLGQVAPPAHLGGYSLVAALAQTASVGTGVDTVDFPGGRQAAFDGMLELMRIGQGWEKWSHGYGGDVLYWDELLLGRSTVTLTLPAGTRVFSLFLEPNFFGPASFAVTAANGVESILLDAWSVEGEGGARGLAFGVRAGAPDLVSITFSGLNTIPDGFGFGELALNGAPHVPSVPERTATLGLLLGLITAGLAWRRRRRWFGPLLALALAGGLQAAPPVVRTVPWVANKPLIPHSTYAGRTITLKGVCDQEGASLQWAWDFGDGAPVATGTVTNRYVLEATHTYTGSIGTVFTARLTVHNSTTGESGSAEYYVAMEEKTLAAEVNVAIDEGLWYLHKTQHRFTASGVDLGDWNSSGYASSGWYGLWAANVTAFEVNGHLETGPATNPYTETVGRGLRRLFETLTTRTITPQALGNPDTNGNGYGVVLNQSYQYYQGGMIMDAIVASGTPDAVTATGVVPSGANPGIRGRTYRAIVQDMVDDHAWAQYDDVRYGGWRYSANDFPDNSACQWAAIGLIAAERSWGCTIPSWVKTANTNWLAYSQVPAGPFGYTAPGSYAWGPYASTPSGLVQMALVGLGRGSGGVPSWEAAEGYLRDNFGNTGGPYYAIKDYYYGLFSFVKSMLLHPGVGGQIKLLRSTHAGVPELDWYAAETSRGAPTDGVARTLVNDQSPGGYWRAHNYSSDQYPFETAWAVMMLQRTLFESGAPVAVARSIPNPSVSGQTVTLDGSDSYHQDATKAIDSWAWDLNNDGTIDLTGAFATATFASLGNHLVRLIVTDNGVPEKTAETILTVRVTTPPLAPTADANGPYIFFPDSKPWFLDGTRSVNPDEGQSEPHLPAYPGDRLQLFAWDLDGDGDFDDATGPTPDVTAHFSARGPGSYLIRLRVTDTTASSYPSSGSGDLSSTTVAQVFVEAGPGQCVNLAAVPLLKDVQLSWSWPVGTGPYPGVEAFHIYRGTVAGGPYVKVGSVPAALPQTYLDHPGILNQVYHYVVRPAQANGDELCQSNAVAAEPLHPAPTVGCVPTVVSNTARYYYTLKAASECFGRNQLQVYVADLGSGLVAGPYATEWLVYIRTGMANPGLRPGSGAVRAYVMTKGPARVWAVDPIGQVSADLIIP
jgi:PKD repeat protein